MGTYFMRTSIVRLAYWSVGAGLTWPASLPTINAPALTCVDSGATGLRASPCMASGSNSLVAVDHHDPLLGKQRPLSEQGQHHTREEPRVSPRVWPPDANDPSGGVACRAIGRRDVERPPTHVPCMYKRTLPRDRRDTENAYCG